MKKYLIVIFFFILCASGCGKKYTITPDVLPAAHVNQNYSQTINIDGGKVVDQYAKLETNIPKELGIIIQPINNLDGYNIIEVKGVPKYSGVYTITIKADFFGGGGAGINKTYDFIVTD